MPRPRGLEANRWNYATKIARGTRYATEDGMWYTLAWNGQAQLRVDVDRGDGKEEVKRIQGGKQNRTSRRRPTPARRWRPPRRRGFRASRPRQARMKRMDQEALAPSLPLGGLDLTISHEAWRASWPRNSRPHSPTAGCPTGPGSGPGPDRKAGSRHLPLRSGTSSSGMTTEHADPHFRVADLVDDHRGVGEPFRKTDPTLGIGGPGFRTMRPSSEFSSFPSAISTDSGKVVSGSFHQFEESINPGTRGCPNLREWAPSGPRRRER